MTKEIRKTCAKLAWLLCSCAGLAACNGQDWRAQAIADAEDKVRSEMGDPSAQFSKFQVTGDSSTGQTCGVVLAKTGGGREDFARFIVYIDGTAGPYIDKGMGAHPIAQEKFDFAWQNDCLNEGYNS